MPLLDKDEVKNWGRARVEQEMRERLEQVAGIRERAGGSLAEVKGDEAQRVREHNGDLEILGERLDEIRELETAEQNAERLGKALDTPRRRVPHPGANGDEGRREIDLRDAGAIFAQSEAIKAFRESGQKGLDVEVPIGALLPEYRVLDIKGFRAPGMKAVLGSNDSLTNVDTEYPPESVRTGVLVEQLWQQPNIADLIPQATINQAAVPYMEETVNSEGAAEVEEAGAIPEASIEFAEKSAPVQKIAVSLPTTEEILEDEELVRGHINARLPQFIRNREDNQLLNGNGSAPNLQGILGLSGIDASTEYGIDDDASVKLEAVFRAAMRVSENFLTPEAVVMGLGLWEQIRLAKDGNENYLIAPATDQAVPRVWGLRVVTNERMPKEEDGETPILVGAFSQASQIWRRRGITLAVSDSHGTRFLSDILTVKATTRLAVTHYRPGGYAVVTSNAGESNGNGGNGGGGGE